MAITAFNAEGRMKIEVDQKLEATGRIDGIEAAAWLACEFSHATKNNYPAIALLDCTLIGRRYRVTVEKVK